MVIFVYLPNFLSHCFSNQFTSLLEHLICDGLSGVAEAGMTFLQRNGKPSILLSWITFFSAVYGEGADGFSLNQILLQVMAVFVCYECINLALRNGLRNLKYFYI